MATVDERKTNIINILKGIHLQREKEITDLLKTNRRADDYLRRMDREDVRYKAITDALAKYFMNVDEWKKSEGVE
jgi:hypothetical protein